MRFSRSFSLLSFLSSSSSSTTATTNVFNSNVKAIQRSNAVRLQLLESNQEQFDYLHKEIAGRLVERLDDLDFRKRKFENILDLYSFAGMLPQELHSRLSTFGAKQLTCAHSSKEFLHRHSDVIDKLYGNAKIKRVQMNNDEDLSTFAENSFDLVVSNLGLHWINDLPGVLSNIQRILKPDGYFLGTMLGGDTLQELRSAFLLAEQERDGGISRHVSPSMQFQDGARLLTSTNFKITAVDVDNIEVVYPDAFALMHDLRCMGESNANISIRFPVPKSTMMAMAAIYQNMYASENAEMPGVRATFQVIYLSGWKADESQQQPLQRGSGRVSMIDALEKEDFFTVKTISMDDSITNKDKDKDKR